MSIEQSEKTRLRDLIARRSSIKGQITKYKNYLDKLCKSSAPSDLESAELTLKLAKFETLSLKFDDLQSQIEVINSYNLDSELDEREGIEQDFILAIATTKGILNKISLDESRRESICSPAHCSSDNSNLGVKLPQIHISKFDGSYFRWLEFRDTFTNLIQNNSRLSEIQKYHYLISYLEGEAARIVANLEISTKNYKEAWGLLCARYDNKRLLINHHLKSLFNMQPLSRESDKSLRFLIDHVTKNLRALSSLGQPTDKWDLILIYMLTTKLDNQTLLKWEEKREHFEDLPSLDQFFKFLNNRADVLESLNNNKFNNNQSKIQNTQSTSFSNNHKNKQITENQPNKQLKSFSSINQKSSLVYTCIICDKIHKIYDCPVFKSKNVNERLAEVAKYKLCSNCLRQGHAPENCMLGPCRECNKKHNTLLHKPSDSEMKKLKPESLVNYCNENSEIILCTAMIRVKNPKTNESILARGLLDCGSQSSFISSSLRNALLIETRPIDRSIIGIGNNTVTNITESCTVDLHSTCTDFKVTFSCLIMDELTGKLPKQPINISMLSIPKNIVLADPNFHQPAKIDILIGADLFWDIVKCDQKSLGYGKPVLRSSQLGWLVAGPIKEKKSNSVFCNHSITSPSQQRIEDLISKFWDLEEVPQSSKLSIEEQAAEKHFLANTTRLPTGRFSVRLPLKESPICLGNSLLMAKKRFSYLEKRFRKNTDLKSQYVNFIREYEELGHLSAAPVTNPDTYFLCHHAVLKQNSESTKLRVVFDGSAPTTSGFSVNDILIVGPNMQSSLFSILLRARTYKYLMTGDIEKMYRQVQVDRSDRYLQVILWREDESQPLRTLQLNTVTYGTASASYLATRCLWQAAEECVDETTKTIIQQDFYVDDLVTGADDEATLQHIKISVTEALSLSCFRLRKFKSNSAILNSNSDSDNQNLTFSESQSTLGLGWNPTEDYFFFPIEIPPQLNQASKRTIMSSSFKIFDPLGLLSPIIIQPKIILQRLWKEKLTWDEFVPQGIQDQWDDFSKNLHVLSSFSVPRRVLCDFPIEIQLHSFCDASQLAYGACVYLRSTNNHGEVTVKLLCSKSKVAPVRPTTIPRLELCAALLSAKLCRTVSESLRITPSQYVHWSDSQVVLGWLRGDPSRLKTFAANRVCEILENTMSKDWRYVPTQSNPADLISRGVNCNYLLNLDFWWSGPVFLAQPASEWPTSNLNIKDLPEMKANIATVNFNSIHPHLITIENFSKFTKIQRTIAYVKRFIHNLRNPNQRKSGFLNLNELTDSFNLLCLMAQKQSFPKDYDQLKNKKSLSPKSKILCLSPFLDQNNLIRVGGRIRAGSYKYEKRHPILLDGSHHLTKLLFEREHKRHLHAGPQLLLSVIREWLWPINGRRVARNTVHRCVVCRRLQGKTLCPKMGDLPSQRLNVDFPFVSVGVDFAGPFYTLNRKGRGAKLQKSYLCLFVCLRFKCLHLEAVSDLTKESFIQTLSRFISRRGKPTQVFCDNGRNFVAAARELGQFLKSNNSALSDYAGQEGFEFNFTPTYAPHFGGIWEAGVKSAKYHIKRVMGNSHLTFEELSTLFAQVEAILNSRPLCPLSSSPDDLLALSPGHFLIGRQLTSLPTPDLTDHKESQLNRYARLELVRQHFWKRWQREYITQLQQRSKWKINTSTLQVGDMVLLQDDNAPPLSWRLGRVSRLFPGRDGIARVADVTTNRGCVRRPLVRLCPLPTAEDLQC